VNIRTPAGFAKLNARERVVASAVLTILRSLESIQEYTSQECRAEIMDNIEASVIKLAKLFY